MELIFNPCGEFPWSPGGPVSQIHSPHLCVGAPGIFSELLRSGSDAKERVECGKQREGTAPIQSLVKLLPWFLSFWWKTCLRKNCSLGSCACSEGPVLGQNTHDDDDDDGHFMTFITLPVNRLPTLLSVPKEGFKHYEVVFHAIFSLHIWRSACNPARGSPEPEFITEDQSTEPFQVSMTF